MVFSDEAWVKVGNPRRYYRQKKEMKPRDIIPLEKEQRGPKVMVWVALSKDGIINIQFINGNEDGDAYVEILEKGLRRYLGEFKSKELIFQHDLASSHTCNMANKFFETNGFKPLPWPPQSPDLI